ncbi:MAG: hypothetical protein M0002_14935 [Rhodospirillales bacterium]|nr:hypothetical protein [Rhodospirillales bacterium]
MHAGRGEDWRILREGVWRHRVEVEIRPAEAELYFRDERWTDRANTEIRFRALVCNADTGVNFAVIAPDGSPGAGTIDQTGLYRAPDKGLFASGTTDLVVATARADPLRKAFAFVTLIGVGPLPVPAPTIELWPKSRTLYYASGDDNAYIDERNKMQLFRAFPRNSPATGVIWLVDGAVQGGSEVWFLYRPPPSGGTAEHSVTVQIPGMPQVADTAKVIVLNYVWPGL